MANPIRPEEVAARKQLVMPDAVLETFNELITRDFSGGVATVRQDEVVRLLVAKGFFRVTIFGNGWLNVEDIYRKVGWQVEYDKPGYNESYGAYFKFTAPGK